MSKYLSTLAPKCQSVARCLTYNKDEHQALAKHALLEASYALNDNVVKVKKTAEGLLITDARGKSRLLTINERFAFWILGKTEIRP